VTDPRLLGNVMLVAQELKRLRQATEAQTAAIEEATETLALRLGDLLDLLRAGTPVITHPKEDE
jgi:hypothetical protein